MEQQKASVGAPGLWDSGALGPGAYARIKRAISDSQRQVGETNKGKRQGPCVMIISEF